MSKTSEQDTYFAQVEPLNLHPAWKYMPIYAPVEPTTPCVPAVWHFADIEPHLMEGCRVISAKDAVESVIQPLPWIGGPEADGAYYLCLVVFAVLVVAYTAWGGFRAVVWTDVLQGVVMLLGVVILLGLALSQVGGLANATREVARMVPPENGVLQLEVSGETKIPQGTWFKLESENQLQYFEVCV